jgi:4-hydroxy-3-polyprenylbenzoate decarboxylase
MNDLRDWIELLRAEGELAEITAEVDPHLEITEIADRTMKAGGPALLFRNVRGSSMPVLINQFGTERRMCLALGVASLEEVRERVAGVFELLQPPKGLGAVLDAAATGFRTLKDSKPRIVSDAPCQEVVVTEPDLDALPIMTCWPDDGGPFITLPSVITRDPVTGGRNVGMYRLQKHSRTTLGLHWQIHKDGAADWREGGAGRMEVAIALGTDPVTAYAGSMPLPKHIDELAVAGVLRNDRVDLVRCKTVDLEVPAGAEIVIEGYAERGVLEPEGPFGDHTGYYTPVEPFPVLHVTCITHRRDPIYPSIVVGVPPSEDVWLGKATERIFLPAVQMTLPEVVDYDLPFAGVFHNCCIVAIRKRYPGHARKVMHAVWGTGLLSLTKAVVVVDEWVDVHDYEQVVWQLGANVDPARDVVLSTGPLDQLDHAPNLVAMGGKIGFDATRTWPEEGYPRTWPEVARMSDEVRRRVDERWDELGIAIPREASGPAPATARGRRGWLPRRGS